MNKLSRFSGLDIISGLFITQIVLMHVLQWANLYKTGTLFDEWQSIFFFFMPWFYFKAGLFINRKKSVKEHLRHDIKRLLIPFVVFSLVGSFVYIGIELWNSERPLWKILLSPLVGIIRDGSPAGNLPLWFLLSLFWSRLLFRLISDRHEILSFIMACVAGAILAFYDLRLPFSLSTAFPGLAFLFLGKWSKNIVLGNQKFIFLNNRGGVILCVILFCLLLVAFHPNDGFRLNRVSGNYFAWIVTSYVGCVALSLIFRYISFSLFEYLGRNSMLYYVIHWIPIMIAHKTITSFVPDLSPKLLLLSVFCFVCVTLGVCSLPGIRKQIPAWVLGEKK